jgi:exopolyphosphatase/guanosine-5'-triphosphate,3'-diphosphate pyrophosphatase
LGGTLNKAESHFASIDIGSHTIRLLIAELVNSKELAPVRVERTITRLARNFQNGEKLTSASMQQSIDVLKAYHELLVQYNVGFVACGATGVLRRAGNANEFLQNIKTYTGLGVPILSEEAEAMLSAKGILSVLADTPRGILLFDLGGSSTEFLLIDSEQPEPIWDKSVFIGAATITDKHLPGDPPKEESIDAAINAIHNEIEPVIDRVTASLHRLDISLQDLLVVGTAGTVTTLAAIYLQMDDYKPYRVNGLSLSKKWLKDTVDHLARLSIASRQGIPGLEKGREDIILGGALIVAGILDTLKQDRLTVTDAGLLEGLLLDLIEKQYDLPQTLRTPLTWHWQKSRRQSLDWKG